MGKSVFVFGALALLAVMFMVKDLAPASESDVELEGMPNGKFYLMKMIRRQVQMKQNEKKHKGDAAIPKVHVLRSYKQIMKDNIARLKAIKNSKAESKQINSALKNIHGKHLKLKAMQAVPAAHDTKLLQLTPQLFQTEATVLQQAAPQQPNQPPPQYGFRPLQPYQVQAAPQYAVQSSAQPGYPPQPGYQAPGYPQGAPPQQEMPEEEPYYPQAQAAPQQQAPQPEMAEPAQQPAPQQMAAAPAPAGQAGIDPMAPSFVVPPTPAGTYSAPCQVEFTVQALGLHQHDEITISLVSGPAGSSISPPITSNPGSTIFTWQPKPAELTSGSSTQQACFQARDRTGLTRNKCITVTATGGPNCEAGAPPQPQAQQPQQQQQQPQFQQQAQQQPQQQTQEQPQQPPQQPQAEPQSQQPQPQQPPQAQQQAQQPGYPAQQQQQPEQQQGYPPQQQGYPPQQQQGYPPAPYQQQPGYPPQQQGYPPAPYQQPYQYPPPQYQQPPQPEGPQAASHTDCVPLFYYINSDLRDHFYTTNFKELEGGKLHYSFMGVMTGVYATYKSGTIPVYRYYNNFDHDHVYTSNYKKWGKGGTYRTPDGEHGYTYEGVAFYIYKYPRQGLNPIYVFVNPKNGNKIFSMSNQNSGPHSDNFKLQGQIGYGGCTPSANDGMQLSSGAAFNGGPPAFGPGAQKSSSPIKMPGGGPPDDNVGLMNIPKI